MTEQINTYPLVPTLCLIAFVLALWIALNLRFKKFGMALASVIPLALIFMFAKWWAVPKPQTPPIPFDSVALGWPTKISINGGPYQDITWDSVDLPFDEWVAEMAADGVHITRVK